MFETNLIIILGVSLVSWFVFLKLTHGIKTIIAPDGADNGNLIRAAAKSNEWKWPSDMHTRTYVGTSTHQRDITLLLVVLFQKIFRDKKGEYPLVALWGFANVASTFLIYLIGSTYWGPNIALLISILYFASFWMWQMSLFVAHLNVGTMFFLLAVYFTTQSVGATPVATFIWLFASGLSLASMLFASSSSLRYLVLFFVAVFFAKHQAITQEINFSSFYNTIVSNDSLVLSLILLSLILIALLLIKIFYKKIITVIFNRKAPRFLNNLIEAKKYSLDYYVKKAAGMIKNGSRYLIKPGIFLFILVNVLGFSYFIPIFAGFTLVVLILTLPNIKKNLTFYFNYIYISYIRPGINSTFIRYIRSGFFAGKGENIPPHNRGGGTLWVPKIFFRMAPFHTLIYVATFIAIIITSLTSTPPIPDYNLIIILALVSLLPILWAELTKAYQISRSYSSGLVGFLVMIGFGASVSQEYLYFWPIAISLLAVTLTWNLWKFFSDIYPSRMTFNKIVKKIEKFNIKEIYTYKTFYNDTFLLNVETTPSLKDLKIHFIESIKDVRDGWIFVPNTSHRAAYIQDDKLLKYGDFTDDPVLNELLDTRKIEDIATAKFRTVSGPSKIWPQENDVMSYLDLMLHDITEKERFRCYAWLLHSSKLHS